jgi:UDP-glucose/galactose:(glucosyl)LPS alpha-1,2-glucosyl/galactosyltransferase
MVRELAQMKQLPPIVFCCNRRFFPPLSVAVASICQHAGHPAALRFVIAASDVPEDDQKAFADWVHSTWGAECRFFHVAKEQLAHFPITAHYTAETYMRFFVLEEIAKTEPKALYLDADTMALGDVGTLLKKEFSDNIFYAVENPGFDRYSELSIPEGKPYFNAGMMYVDLQKWSEQKITRRVVTFIRENPAELFKLVDQDALNAVLHDAWSPVGPEWNFQRKFWHALTFKTTYSSDEILNARQYPKLIHFNGRSKPWNVPFLVDMKLGRAYKSLAMQTSWGEENMSTKSLTVIINELLRLPLRHTKQFLLKLSGKAV